MRWTLLGSGLLALGLLGACSKDGKEGPDFGSPTGGNSGDGAGGDGVGGGGGPGGGGPGGGGAGGEPYEAPPVGDPFHRDDTGMSGLGQEVIDQLKAGGGADLPVIYPYENTVFPAGLLPPIIQWTGDASAAYVHMEYSGQPEVKYEFATGPSNPGRIVIPHGAWTAITDRASRQPLVVKISAIVNGSVRTHESRWRVAQGRLEGSIYYNTYDAPGGQAGAIMRLQLGQTDTETFLTEQGFANPVSGPCYGCHSVSANGEKMASTYHSYLFPLIFEAFTYDLAANPNPEPPRQSPNIHAGSFGALTPSGDKYLTMGNPQCTAGSDTFPRTPNNFPLVEGPAVPTLRNASSGAPLSGVQGLQADHYMWMPQFSPDGTKVVFNHARPDGNGRTNRRTLAMMDFDNATNTFSNLRTIYTDDGPTPSLPYHGYTWPAGAPFPVPGDCAPVQRQATYNDTCSGPCYPGWPFFTPDNKKVIFVRGTEPDFMSSAPGGRDNIANGELWIVDVESGAARRLDQAGGYQSDTNNSYLPPGNVGYEYFPTVMPVPAGGYFWVFWTSRRAYGNIQPNAPTGGLAGATGHQKKIWVSAINPDGQGEFSDPNADPSHPAFYLRGQSESGNVRAFSALNPCVTEGQSCRTGIDCCTGLCNWDAAAGEGVCVIERECSQRTDRCTQTSDCCPVPEGEEPLDCLGGVCDVLGGPS